LKAYPNNSLYSPNNNGAALVGGLVIVNVRGSGFANAPARGTVAIEARPGEEPEAGPRVRATKNDERLSKLARGYRAVHPALLRAHPLEGVAHARGAEATPAFLCGVFPPPDGRCIRGLSGGSGST
jgi:hypothetical protein